MMYTLPMCPGRHEAEEHPVQMSEDRLPDDETGNGCQVDCLSGQTRLRGQGVSMKKELGMGLPGQDREPLGCRVRW